MKIFNRHLSGRVFPAFMLMLFFSAAASGHEAGIPGPGPGFEEKTGQYVPPGLVFNDEQGRPVRLGDLIHRPAILAPVYYSCSHLCPQLLAGIAGAVGSSGMGARNDYSIIAVSIDDADTPQDALRQKKNYLKAAGGDFRRDSWKFMTGSAENIRKLTDAVGINFVKTEHGFIHPEILVILSPTGRITRYVGVSGYTYGSGYAIALSSSELAAALSDAAREQVSAGVRIRPVYCSLHKPSRQDLFFKILGAAGAITLVISAAFFLYLRAGEKKRYKGREGRL